MNRVSAVNQARSPGSYRIRPAFRRSTAFSCRSTTSSAFFSSSPRTTRTARLNNQRMSRQTILSSTWSANHHRTSLAGGTARSTTRSRFRAAQDQPRRAPRPPEAGPRRTHPRIPDRRLTAPARCYEKRAGHRHDRVFEPNRVEALVKTVAEFWHPTGPATRLPTRGLRRPPEARWPARRRCPCRRLSPPGPVLAIVSPRARHRRAPR